MRLLAVDRVEQSVSRGASRNNGILHLRVRNRGERCAYAAIIPLSDVVQTSHSQRALARPTAWPSMITVNPLTMSTRYNRAYSEQQVSSVRKMNRTAAFWLSFGFAGLETCFRRCRVRLLTIIPVCVQVRAHLTQVDVERFCVVGSRITLGYSYRDC